MLTFYIPNNYSELLDYCSKNNQNPRFNIIQFSKYLPFIDGENCFFYGCYENENLVALSVLKKCKDYSDCIYISSIQTLYPGKEYGKKLLQHILNNDKFVYFLCNPEADEKLHDYYVKNFDCIRELKIENSIYDGKTIYFFYKIYDMKRREILINNLMKEYSR